MLKELPKRQEHVFLPNNKRGPTSIIRDKRKLDYMGGGEVLLSNHFTIISLTVVKGKSI
jgi:hypothetical protein